MLPEPSWPPVECRKAVYTMSTRLVTLIHILASPDKELYDREAFEYEVVQFARMVYRNAVKYH